MKTYYIYLMMNPANTVIYAGITNDLIRRVYEHRNHLVEGFTKKYNVIKLVFFEEYKAALEAISRENK